AGVEVEMADLEAHSEAVEHAMLELMERMKQGQSAEGGEEDEDEEHEEEPATPEREAASKEKQLDFDTRNRIEKMFERARRERGKAVQLKQELDKLGVFKQYEDRFLDLFRRAE